MSFATRVPLGAPGVYRAADVPLRRLTGERMDVCAFVGVAPRGPARVPVVDEKWPDDRPCVEPARPRYRTSAVAVESFDEYRELYGGFEGPGRLPYAVASFFENGGRRAYVARIVHDYGNPGDNAGRVSRGTFEQVSTTVGPLQLDARNEGLWGDGLRASLSFKTHPVAFLAATASTIDFDASQPVVVGALLRVLLPGSVQALRFIIDLRELPAAAGSPPNRRATLSVPLAMVPEAAELVEGSLMLDDGAGRTEILDAVGLASGHPRWLAHVLCYESKLAWPAPEWIGAEVELPDASLGSPPVCTFTGGADDYPAIVPEDFFDPLWTLGDDVPGSGIHSLVHISDLTQVAIPDLYSPEPLARFEGVLTTESLAGAEFEECRIPAPPGKQERPPGALDGLYLDPNIPADLARIIALQQRAVNLAEQLRNFIVLLDVPLGLNQRRILAWRTSFDSSYAAAYHPWLVVSRPDDLRDALIRIPPSSAAAGIIARTEIAFGVPQGPANTLSAGVLDVTDEVSPARHDQLHPQGINVYLRERDGIRLTAARTLSRDNSLRQLSVRRLMLMLRRTLDRRMQWVVFEPNNQTLRADLTQLLKSFLRGLYQQGAFRGDTEKQAFFVRCDDVLNPARLSDNGQLVAEIGVAPAEPLEFIVLRLARDGDGTLTIEE